MEKPVVRINSNVFECTILERINRFTTRVLLNKGVVEAHINNTGRLREILVTGRKGYCIEIGGSKLKYRLIAVSDRGYGALIDTSMQENAFIQAVHRNYIPWLENCLLIRRNVKLYSSVIDCVFKCIDREVFVETKSAVLRVDEHYAGYPDCPTLRGRKQIDSLISYALSGETAYLVFIAALPDITGFKPYDEGDPVVGRLIREAFRKGVYVKAINIYYRPVSRDIVLANPDLNIYL